MANTYMPINISLKNRTCLVVGGGKVALRKIDTMIEYESQITVIAPRIGEKIKYYAGKQQIKIEEREYKSPEAGNYGLVISASDDQQLNELVCRDSRKAGVLVNVVDNPPLCDFTFPAVIKRDCITVAIATDGKAPFLSGHLRMILENIFQDHWKKMARYASQFRLKVQERWKDDKARKIECFDRFLNADWKTLIKEKKGEDMEKQLDEFLENQG